MSIVLNSNNLVNYSNYKKIHIEHARTVKKEKTTTKSMKQIEVCSFSSILPDQKWSLALGG